MGYPRSGESELSWAIRLLESRDRHVSKALSVLARLDVVEDKRSLVSRRLIAYLQATGGKRDWAVTLQAMLRWRTSETDMEILSFVGKPTDRADTDALMAALAGLWYGESS